MPNPIARWLRARRAQGLLEAYDQVVYQHLREKHRKEMSNEFESLVDDLARHNQLDQVVDLHWRLHMLGSMKPGADPDVDPEVAARDLLHPEKEA